MQSILDKRPWTGAEESLSNVETVEKCIRTDEPSDDPNVSSESNNDQVSLFGRTLHGRNLLTNLCNARCVQCAFVQRFGI